jgi:hypothetical protein
MSQSSMENLKDFEERIRRIEGGSRKSGRVRQKSSGEYFRNEEERRRRSKKGKKANWTARILLVLVAFAGVKTYIMGSMGDEAYEARMAELQAGDKYQKMAFAVMQSDPVTGKLQQVLVNYGVFAPKPALRETLQQTVAAPVAEAAPEKQEAGSIEVEPASGSSVSEGESN